MGYKSVICPTCLQEPGWPCQTISGSECGPHATRIRRALMSDVSVHKSEAKRLRKERDEWRVRFCFAKAALRDTEDAATKLRKALKDYARGMSVADHVFAALNEGD